MYILTDDNYIINIAFIVNTEKLDQIMDELIDKQSNPLYKNLYNLIISLKNSCSYTTLKKLSLYNRSVPKSNLDSNVSIQNLDENELAINYGYMVNSYIDRIVSCITLAKNKSIKSIDVNSNISKCIKKKNKLDENKKFYFQVIENTRVLKSLNLEIQNNKKHNLLIKRR